MEKYKGGALFKNTYKTKDGQPDYKGILIHEGVKYELAGWIKEGKGGTYISLSEPKRKDAAHNKAAEPQRSVTLDDDIPFIHVGIGLLMTMLTLVGGA